mmetsp:Transcript_16171/g.41529  ORF Transcript_16171/g.41529 Transcript_16171/m.41529 type:complete len:438 (-) Transcript_16171:44-1357(-)|eukprot:CAMPEP_0174234936 /NCGR_PEP_ID=MMETSP0417-20130205/4540_1 /TAXON_ID=242541 /ORGANISM="Mayorella sp, Strain BSH-02190019" /LENGTH=437 /DNA_ID=CAMNT_0015313367 /DNA_START=118 /DNA_END=1431 /DNA_ORIENTATION=+
MGICSSSDKNTNSASADRHHQAKLVSEKTVLISNSHQTQKQQSSQAQRASVVNVQPNPILRVAPPVSVEEQVLTDKPTPVENTLKGSTQSSAGSSAANENGKALHRKKSVTFKLEPDFQTIVTSSSSSNKNTTTTQSDPSQQQNMADQPPTQLTTSASAQSSRFGGLERRAPKGKGPLSRQLAVEQGPEYARFKASSTSTLYISSTLSSPDVNEIIKCMSVRLSIHMKKAELQGPPTKEDEQAYEIFNEEIHPIDKRPYDTTNLPIIDEVYEFINSTFEAERLSHECGILTLAYIERIMENSTVRLRPNNWRRMVLAAIILASKVWEDQAVWNVDFLNAFPCLTVKDLGQLEKKYLSLLMFNVSLSGSQYARYYFDLRELSDKEPKDFPLKPLDKDGQERLESRSRKHEAKTRRQTRNKGKSVDWELAVRSPKVVLS